MDELLPQWTVPSFQSIAGRYPLGLEAVSLNILATKLAPGLPVLSRHPRYWSIYTYLIKRFQDTQKPTKTTKNPVLGRYLKSREIVFASAALLHHLPEFLRNVVGSDTLGPWLRRNQSTTTSLPVSLEGELGSYLQQSMGGYGQIYRGAMADLELVLHPENIREDIYFDIAWGELGTVVANTFASAIAETRYVKEFIDKDIDEIPLNVVRELGEVSCFCLLRHHEPERRLLTDVLLGKAQATFHKEPQAIDKEYLLYRRRQRAETVRMFLDLADQTQNIALSQEDIFRNLLYYGHSENGAAWYPERQRIQGTWRQWWLIQLREWVVGALNGIFRDFVSWGNSRGGLFTPLPIREYVQYISTLSLTLPSIGEKTLQDLSLGQLSTMIDDNISSGAWPLRAQKGEIEKISERSRLRQNNPAMTFLTLLVSQRRYARIQQQQGFLVEEVALLREGNRDRLSTNYIFDWLADQIAHDMPASQTFEQLMQEMIVSQHIRVALSKLNSNADTFRFHEEEDGVRFTPYSNVDISSISVRFEAISEALYGLDLISASLTKPSHGPTTYGWEILNAEPF
ncbi:hypothetical protein KDW_39630 [Dictyobacter vulcani]|uniref:Uncharacterized protein n=1 Tax=Dictyobacter vulcani TaxID=2607529 RepID=A0A5J4KTK6_9CHLR|nr:hypothetical protein [Dictyobacter vulcani]GER89801.1 hypothetical protein KDW_39630 [Dictyobacter vulcani]